MLSNLYILQYRHKKAPAGSRWKTSQGFTSKAEAISAARRYPINLDYRVKPDKKKIGQCSVLLDYLVNTL